MRLKQSGVLERQDDDGRQIDFIEQIVILLKAADQRQLKATLAFIKSLLKMG